MENVEELRWIYREAERSAALHRAQLEATVALHRNLGIWVICGAIAVGLALSAGLVERSRPLCVGTAILSFSLAAIAAIQTFSGISAAISGHVKAMCRYGALLGKIDELAGKQPAAPPASAAEMKARTVALSTEYAAATAESTGSLQNIFVGKSISAPRIR